MTARIPDVAPGDLTLTELLDAAPRAAEAVVSCTLMRALHNIQPSLKLHLSAEMAFCNTSTNAVAAVLNIVASVVAEHVVDQGLDQNVPGPLAAEMLTEFFSNSLKSHIAFFETFKGIR